MAKIFELSLLTPAKLNLFLKVTGKREDGYHNLYSLFVPITLFDKVKIYVGKKKGITLKSDLGIPHENNLAFKAAKLFFDASGITPSVKIILKKSIPTGGGLGGGSSDAAAVLLGADVPFFLEPVPSIVSGIGEKIKPVKIMKKMWFVLLYPGFESSTARVYEEFDNLTEPFVNIKIKQKFGKEFCMGENDLEGAFWKVYGKKDLLKFVANASGYDFRGISGSGSTLFFGFYTKKKRDDFFSIMKKQKKEKWQIYKANLY